MRADEGPEPIDDPGGASGSLRRRSVLRGSLSADPLTDDPDVIAYLGDRYDAVRAFGAAARRTGELRGLIGPRELGRIWERHLLNSAAVVPFLGDGCCRGHRFGRGPPGLVIAAMEPDRRVVLVEPMERRTAWLREAAETLGLDNVTVVRGRAEEVRDVVEADVVTARAVAAIDKLVKWAAPLLGAGRTHGVAQGPQRRRRARQGEVRSAPGGARRRGARGADRAWP